MNVKKERLLALIKEYQELNDDVNDQWLDMKVYRMKGMTDDSFAEYLKNRKGYTDIKRKWYEEKKKRLESETEEERKERTNKLAPVENELFGIFYEIIDSVTKGFGLYNIRYDELYNDVKQETMLKLLAIVNRFDTSRKNPLAYFIQVIKNIIYAERGDEFKHRYKFLTQTFLDTHEIQMDEDGSVFKSVRSQVLNEEKLCSMEEFIS